MSINSEKVKKWRRKTKEMIIESMGGECICCNYKLCQQAMELHHLDPSEKDFRIASMLANPKSWDKIVKELRKCVLICNRCHTELHFGFRELPETYAKFDESFAEVNFKERMEYNNCPVCGKSKPSYNVTCSRSCAAKRRGKVDWDSVNLEEMLENMSMVQIGKKFGVSDIAVRKRAKKLKLI